MVYASATTVKLPFKCYCWRNVLETSVRLLYNLIDCNITATRFTVTDILSREPSSMLIRKYLVRYSDDSVLDKNVLCQFQASSLSLLRCHRDCWVRGRLPSQIVAHPPIQKWLPYWMDHFLRPLPVDRHGKFTSEREQDLLIDLDRLIFILADVWSWLTDLGWILRCSIDGGD